MAKGDKKAAKAAKAAKKGVPKDIKRAETRWRALEDEIDEEFNTLQRDGFEIAELETLRWDYRYDKLEAHKVTQEQIEFFVAEAEAKAAGMPPPRAPWATAGADAGPAGAARAPALSEEYKRKSQVDLELVEKYLERRVGRETRSEMESVYKEAFGEDLHVPAKVDLVDFSYHASDVVGADQHRRLSKAEILGIPAEANAEDAKAEGKAEAVAAAPAVKKESRAAAAAMAWKRGVPQAPTRDAKWSPWFPFKIWLIPKRLAGTSVPTYYALLIVNLVIFIATLAPLLIPFLFRSIVWLAIYIWRRFLKQRVAPAMQTLKEKAAVPPAGSADAEKKSAPAKST